MASTGRSGTIEADANGNFVRVPERLAYAAGDLASNFYWKLQDFYLLIFYTDVFGLPAASVGTMVLVTKIWDAINDPMIGAISDRTNTRFGKFRPYLLWGALPLGAAGILAFTTPDLDDTGKLIWAYLTYSAMMTAYTIINLPYSALLGVISPNSQERTTLSSIRFVGAFSGGVIVTYFTPKLVDLLGGDNATRGWQLMAAVWAVCAGALYLWTFLGTRERVTPAVSQRQSLKHDLRDLRDNRPWLVLLALAVLVMLNVSLRSAVSAYYMTYVAGREDLVGSFITSGVIASVGGAACTPFLTKWLGKKRLFLVIMVILTALSIAFYFIPRDAIWLMFANNILLNFALGPKPALVFAMYADAADYSEWRSGRRATGFVFAAASFGQKLGGALAAAVVAFTLAAINYVPNVAQTESTLNGIVLLMSVLPAGFAIAAALVVRAYPLADATLETIRKDLANRAATGPGTSA